MINYKYEIKYIIIQVILTLLIAFIPIYFYLDASFENQNIKDKMNLKNYASSVFSKIEDFEKENSTVFYFPRSNIYSSGIFDKENRVIFSLLKNEKRSFNNDFEKSKDKICYKEYLALNILNANSLIVCKDIDNSQVIYNAIILLLSISFFIFLSSFFVIKQSVEPYRKLNQYLDEFLKDAMHELKTPIGVARINVDMLQLRLKNDKYILRIKSALKNMTVIYEDLEYYMQQHAVKDEKENIDFSMFLEKRIEFFSDLAISKNIKIETSIKKNILINFNKIELFRIIDNNISNAIKYSKDSSTIKVLLEKYEDEIKLAFWDEGIGIKNTKKIFERYYRGDKITGGFGIGLSIVKNICKKNKIKIEVNSKPNIGSAFTYTFQKS
ncbi:HAMP domain-containing histidine kinase [Poseidonibacter lekithochrous]|uniref:sensor histidine kinase n=1 Tax=Poseidonibacter TaxID=2321187 RepID=UPI001C085F52|nr:MULTISPECIES: HAMP domain-containing sensor histidine kinase [Poseidonibacter]MBU3013546.1 HAMP domain-containing histidine kinase [Poseidonibacter lekithochrous]MDO6826843.1 HAMP domain-containing sensor histidine kinase [Poseidonibacter sp. 1_MG-2023]